MIAILLIDHGSRRGEANEMLACMAALVQRVAGDGVIVRHAHMELAEATIAQGFAACVEAGASEVIAFPYMLSPGRHSTEDIPRFVAEAAEAHPRVTFRVTPAFGVAVGLAEVILARAGIEPAATLGEEDAARCWHPEHGPGSCGDACPGRANGSWTASSGKVSSAKARTR
jgi:sirohydrochlorin ferrochelatase